MSLANELDTASRQLAARTMAGDYGPAGGAVRAEMIDLSLQMEAWARAAEMLENPIRDRPANVGVLLRTKRIDGSALRGFIDRSRIAIEEASQPREWPTHAQVFTQSGDGRVTLVKNPAPQPVPVHTIADAPRHAAAPPARSVWRSLMHWLTPRIA